MDEERNELNTEEYGDPRDPREVVLRYESGANEVVERYVQPTRLPGRDTELTFPIRYRRKKRRGLKIFLVIFAVLLLAAAGAAAYFSGWLPWFAPGNEPPGETYPASEKTETTIERYPNGDGTRLRFAESHGEALSIQEVYQRVNPSTVTVMATLPGGGVSVGTGVIFTANGYILTNAHVIDGGQDCFVVRDTGISSQAKLVGMDEKKDLAVIKIEGEDLPAAEFGDSDALTVGDTVYAIGNPLGVTLRGTLTDGIVSAINRDVYVDGITMTLIQTNAALNNGNSGGPLINVYGQVIGINTMKMGSTSTNDVEGLGFAIPISSSAYMIDDLIAFGEIRGEGLLGITVLTEPVTLSSGEKALEIIEVSVGGTAHRAGLHAGDHILSADGEALSSSDDLIRIRRRYDAGDVLHLEIERSGEYFGVDVMLTEYGM